MSLCLLIATTVVVVEAPRGHDAPGMDLFQADSFHPHTDTGAAARGAAACVGYLTRGGRPEMPAGHRSDMNFLISGRLDRLGSYSRTRQSAGGVEMNPPWPTRCS